jgi:site-specific DNA recombinase
MQGIYDLLQFAQVALYEVAGGPAEADDIRVTVKALVNSQFMKTLRGHVHRTFHARAREGKSIGPSPYGYRVVKHVNDNGDPIRGDREIDPKQAEIVVRILTEYAAGVSPFDIVMRLNDEGIKGPGGGKWKANAIVNGRARGRGIINCELYTGILVWNRTHRVRNPETGKETIRVNPPEMWVRTEVPHLRIVSDELWKAVKARQAAIGAQYEIRVTAMTKGRARAKSLNDMHRPIYPFSGRLFCHSCGGVYRIRGIGVYSCSEHTALRTCSQKRSIRREELEARVLATLIGPLTAPAAVATAMKAYKDEAQRLNREWRSSLTVWRKELQETEKRLDEIVDAIEDGGTSRKLTERLHRLEAIRDELEDRIAAAPSEELPIPSTASFRKKAEKLVDAMKHPKDRAEAITILRSLIRRIEIKADAGWRTPTRLTVYGDLAALLGSRIDGGPSAVVIATA